AAYRAETQRRPPGVVGRGRHVPRAGRRGRLPRRPRCAARAAPGRVRVVGHHDLRRGRRQHGALRAHRPVRRRPDGALRHPPGDRHRARRRRRGQWPHGVHDGELAAGALLGRARRAGHRVDGARARRHGDGPLVRRPPRPRLRRADGRRCHRAARLPAADRRGGGVGRVARRRARRRRGGAGRGPAGAAAPAGAPARPGRRPLRRHAGRRPRPGPRRRRRARPARPRRRRAHPPVLVPRGGHDDLRRHDDGADPAALHPGRARPRHAPDRRGRPAGAGGPVRHRRHDRVGLAHRPVRPARAAARLLRAARRVARGAAGAVRAGHLDQHDRVHRVLRAGLGGHHPTDPRPVPGGLRGAGAGGLRLGVRLPPGRRGGDGAGRGRRPGRLGRLRPGLAGGRGALPGRGPAVPRRPPRAHRECAEGL
ncbi:MAG: Uncharacterized MFS-type transporter, partial [uncultured Pseudonocardia sp.]